MGRVLSLSPLLFTSCLCWLHCDALRGHTEIPSHTREQVKNPANYFTSVPACSFLQSQVAALLMGHGPRAGFRSLGLFSAATSSLWVLTQGAQSIIRADELFKANTLSPC